MHKTLSIAAIAILTFATNSFAQVGNNSALVDPNLAGAEDLAASTVIDRGLAYRIVAARPFLNTQQLDDVLAGSLNADERETAYGHVFRQINLNTASRETIMLIPGMSPKMAHEFEEYRPYTSLEQFRREIGKYVDVDEVARLEQYVFIPLSLNDASEDDLKTIPGMSGKMVHEFEEYRPYTSIEQFRREIGKYVDEDEVARLESYVTLD